jgi:phospholipid/cholesterol/gamma-HCH transport system ATP-binding protein
MSQPSDVIISVRGLKTGYGENMILENINFEVRRGEVFVILGGSGSGKAGHAGLHARIKKSRVEN